MNKKGQILGWSIGIGAIAITLIVLLFYFGVFGTNIQFADGFTEAGSSLELSNFTAFCNIYNNDACDYPNAHLPYTTSKYVNGVPGVYPDISTDENIDLSLNHCIVINEPLGRRRVRTDIVTSEGSSLVEVTPDILDNIVTFSVGGLIKGTFDKTQGNKYVQICNVQVARTTQHYFSVNLVDNNNVKIQAPSNYVASNSFPLIIDQLAGGSGISLSPTSQVRVQNLRFRATLGCQKSPTDILAMQNFAAGSTIQLKQLGNPTPFVYTPDQFCPEFIIQTGNSQGGDNYEIIKKIVDGGSYIVPADTVVTALFYFDNKDGLVKVTCAAGQAVNEKGVCQQQTGIITVFTQGTLDTQQGTYTTNPLTVSNIGNNTPILWSVDPNNKTNGTAIQNLPIVNTGNGYVTPNTCVAPFVYNADRHACTASQEDICKSLGQNFNGATGQCESASSIDVKTQEITINSPKSVNGFNWWLWGSVAAILVIIITIIVILVKR